MATEIETTFRVVTPMFCAGAVPEERAELRLPSFKGVLRFWWRALAWAKYGEELQRVRRWEDMLFGSSDCGQSRLLMRLVPDSGHHAVSKGEVLTVRRTDRNVVGEGARYLGYGVMKSFGKQRGQLTRACILAPVDFTVWMRLRKRGLNERKHGHQLASLKDALICLGTQGGMGAKSRKGYGSLVIQSLLVNGEQQWRPPQTICELSDALAELRRNHCAAGQPEYTAISGQARYVLVPSDKSEAMELLDLVGRELMRYRNWGHRGMVLGQESEKEFQFDRDLMKGNHRNRHPRRIAFGLPHNYGKQRERQVGPYDSELDRRASPLFIHLHECGDTPVAVLSFLPARFPPKGKSDISVGGCLIPQRREPELYAPIHNFLDRLLDRKKRKEPFTDVVEVPW